MIYENGRVSSAYSALRAARHEYINHRWFRAAQYSINQPLQFIVGIIIADVGRGAINILRSCTTFHTASRHATLGSWKSMTRNFTYIRRHCCRSFHLFFIRTLHLNYCDETKYFTARDTETHIASDTVASQISEYLQAFSIILLT